MRIAREFDQCDVAFSNIAPIEIDASISVRREPLFPADTRRQGRRS